MRDRRWRLDGLLPAVALLSLAGILFARLIVDPASLIVDGRRPSVDYANLGDPRPVGNDLTSLFLPHHLSIIRAIARYRHLPFWDTRGFGGRPLVGNPQGGLFYPPVWIVWWSGAPAALGWLTIGHLVFGSVGAYILVRPMTRGRWPATVAAGVYLASPFLVAHTIEGHYPHVWSACWYPWAFWAFMEQRRGRRRGLLILPLVLAMTFLTGHPQEWYLLVLALSMWTLADVIKNLRSKRFRPPALPLLTWTGALALSLGLAAVDAAPQLAVRPWLLNGRGSDRGVAPPAHYHVQAVNALQLLSPAALGGPSDYFGHDNYWETVFSIGFVPLVLAIIAANRHPDRRVVRGWLALAGFAVWFACGRQLGLFALSQSLPGMSGFRVPARALFLANLAGAVLAGLGVETIRSTMTELDDWLKLRRRLIGIAMILFIGWLMTDRWPDAFEGPRTSRAIARVLHDPCFWFGTGAMTSLVALACVSPRHRNQTMAGSLLGLLALVELGWSGSAIIRVAPAESFLGAGSIGAALVAGNKCGSVGADDDFATSDAPSPLHLSPKGRGRQVDTCASRIEEHRPLSSDPRPSWGEGVRRTGEGGTPREASHSRESGRALGPDPDPFLATDAESPLDAPARIKARDAFFGDLTAFCLGIEKTNINDVFQLNHCAALYESLYPVASRPRPYRLLMPANEVVEEYNRRFRQAVFDLMSVRFLISDRVEADPPWPVLADGLSNGSRFVIQRNPSALPRAYIVPHAKVVPDGAAHTLSFIRETDPRESVLMSDDPLGQTPAGTRQPFKAAAWTSVDPDHPVLVVTTEAPGLLVVADAWMPGWTARVDGATAPIFRGNHAQRVIPIRRPGRHTIAMDYRPPGLALGCAITAASALIWGLLLCGFVICSSTRRVN